MSGVKRKRDESRLPSVNEYVALDCEFVGVGRGNNSAVGRCSIVDYDGNVLFDMHGRPEGRITNYRTKWSGITSDDMERSIPIADLRSIVKKIIKNRIMVGHSIGNDFNALRITHPYHLVRDTSSYRPLRTLAVLDKDLNPSLKNLSLNLLGRTIQTGAHSSVEDARATMDVFKIVRVDWEKKLAELTQPRNKKRRVNSEEDDSDDDDDDDEMDNDDDDDESSDDDDDDERNHRRYSLNDGRQRRSVSGNHGRQRRSVSGNHGRQRRSVSRNHGRQRRSVSGRRRK